FIFSTALAPPAIGAALAALELVRSQPELTQQLQANAETLRAELATGGIDTGASRTQIIPIVVVEAGRTVELSERLLARGIYTQAIRPPTVPAGTSRLRLAVMANHSSEELRSAARQIARTAAGPGRRVAVFKPAVSGLDDRATSSVPPDHELLRLAARSDQSDDE